MSDIKVIPNPPDKDFEDNPRNIEIAERTSELIAHYRRDGGDPNDIKSTISDMLCDLMIYCHLNEDEDGKPLDFDAMQRSAEFNFEGSRDIDDLEAGILLTQGYCNWDEDTDTLVLADEED